MIWIKNIMNISFRFTDFLNKLKLLFFFLANVYAETIEICFQRIFCLFNRLWLIQGPKMFWTLNTLICNASLGFTELVKELPLQRLFPTNSTYTPNQTYFKIYYDFRSENFN